MWSWNLPTCESSALNMATILKLVCVKGLRGYARFAVLFLRYPATCRFWPDLSMVKNHFNILYPDPVEECV